MWFVAAVPLKSGCNGSVSFWTLWRCVYTAALWQPPQLGWLAVHGVCPQPHAEARGLTSHRAQCTGREAGFHSLVGAMGGGQGLWQLRMPS